MAGRALRTSEAINGAILEAALDCVVTIDHESRVVEWNPAAERTFGHPREAVLGRDMPDMIIPPELREAHRRGLGHYLAGGKGPMLGRHIEVEALRANGSRFPIGSFHYIHHPRHCLLYRPRADKIDVDQLDATRPISLS